jgi:predicted dehydrogenase
LQGAVETQHDKGSLQWKTDDQTKLIIIMRELNIGVIGCGKIGERHLGGYNKINDVSVTVSDIVPERAKELAVMNGVCWEESPADLLSDPEIDAIDVCIPVTEHKRVISEAIENNKHVFCEKPLAQNQSDARELQRQAENAGKILMVGYLYRFHPAFKTIHDVLQNGVIGDPYYAIFRVGGQGSHRAWKHKRENGGGADNEMPVHMLDLMVWYFGDPNSVENLHAETVRKEREIDGETINATAKDLRILKTEMEDGVTVLCESDLITPSYMNYVEIQGTNGTAITSILDYFPTMVYCEEARGSYNEGQNFVETSRVPLFKRELGHFVDCIRNGGTEQINPIKDAVKVHEIIDAAKTVAKPVLHQEMSTDD